MDMAAVVGAMDALADAIGVRDIARIERAYTAARREVDLCAASAEHGSHGSHGGR